MANQLAAVSTSSWAWATAAWAKAAGGTSAMTVARQHNESEAIDAGPVWKFSPKLGKIKVNAHTESQQPIAQSQEVKGIDFRDHKRSRCRHCPAGRRD